MHLSGHILDAANVVMVAQGFAIHDVRQVGIQAMVVGDDIVWHKDADPQCLRVDGEEASVKSSWRWLSSRMPLSADQVRFQASRRRHELCLLSLVRAIGRG